MEKSNVRDILHIFICLTLHLVILLYHIDILYGRDGRETHTDTPEAWWSKRSMLAASFASGSAFRLLRNHRNYPPHRISSDSLLSSLCAVRALLVLYWTLISVDYSRTVGAGSVNLH